MDMTPETSSSPPLSRSAVDLPPEPTSWPTVIGVISIIYAALGATCMLCMSGGMLAAPALFAQFFDADIQIAPILTITTLGVAAVLFGLAIWLGIGGIRLCRRRPSGVKMLKTWAVARIAVLIVQVGLFFVTLGPTIDFQKEMADAQRNMAPPAARQQIPVQSEQMLRAQLMIQTGIGWVIVSVYPLFLGFFLMRRRITDEVETWSETPREVI